jgi:hypothetical protein
MQDLQDHDIEAQRRGMLRAADIAEKAEWASPYGITGIEAARAIREQAEQLRAHRRQP